MRERRTSEPAGNHPIFLSRNIRDLTPKRHRTIRNPHAILPDGPNCRRKTAVHPCLKSVAFMPLHHVLQGVWVVNQKTATSKKPQFNSTAVFCPDLGCFSLHCEWSQMTRGLQMTTQLRTDNRRLIPVSKWNLHHNWPPEGGLRHLIFYSSENGFDRVLRRIGRRVLIDEAAFFEWVDAQDKEARK